jgi:hypothetical protein
LYFQKFFGACILGPNLILEISLFGSRSSKPPGLECICMSLGPSPHCFLPTFCSKVSIQHDLLVFP